MSHIRRKLKVPISIDVNNAVCSLKKVRIIKADCLIWMVLRKGAILLFLFSFKNKNNSYFVSDPEKKVDSEILN